MPVPVGAVPVGAVELRVVTLVELRELDECVELSQLDNEEVGAEEEPEVGGLFTLVSQQT